MTREQIEARIETVQRMHANARRPSTLAALNRCLDRLIMMEAEDDGYTGLRCPHCQSKNWTCKFKSPTNPAEDRFVCFNNHEFRRYNEEPQRASDEADDHSNFGLM